MSTNSVEKELLYAKEFENKQKNIILEGLNNLDPQVIGTWEYYSGRFYKFFREKNVLFVLKNNISGHDYDELEVIRDSLVCEYAIFDMEDIRDIIYDIILE